MKPTNTQNRLTVGAALISGLLLSTAATAIETGGGNGDSGSGQGFAALYDRASGEGRCSVDVVRGSDSTYYIPSDSSNRTAQFNVLVWGNGTGGNATTYRSMLESVASHCIIVAAANTDNSGTGREMKDALDSARSRYSSIIAADARVCTAGHSQGGGGSFNAANRIDADCVIPVQPDTRWTTQIDDDLADDVEVITIWGSSDTLAPASGNSRNVEGASSILTQVETNGEGHFAPTSGTGGIVGIIFRMANIAQLSPDASLRTEFRGAFFGPTTSNTVTENNRNISNVERDNGAVSTAP